MNEIEQSPPVTADLQRFEELLLNQLSHAGLPTEGVLVNVSERGRMLSNVEGALEQLAHEDRRRSFYVSKMVVAVAGGLFDAALNYLWDETVAELRRRVSGYDIATSRSIHPSAESSFQLLRILLGSTTLTFLEPVARSDWSAL